MGQLCLFPNMKSQLTGPRNTMEGQHLKVISRLLWYFQNPVVDTLFEPLVNHSKNWLYSTFGSLSFFFLKCITISGRPIIISEWSSLHGGVRGQAEQVTLMQLFSLLGNLSLIKSTLEYVHQQTCFSLLLSALYLFSLHQWYRQRRVFPASQVSVRPELE